MALSKKSIGILVVLGIVLVVGAWQGLSYTFKYGYSRGTRSGILRKFSVKGSPVCKYGEGELALQGATPGQPAEIFTFTVDDHGDSSPLVQKLKQAEREAKRVTLDYRQDKSKEMWWRCNPNEYFVTAVN